MSPDGFHDLLQQAQGGDRQAMAKLLAAVRPDLLRWAQAYATPDHPEAGASDLVQSVCVRAWQHLDQFHCEADDKQALAQFRAWMGQMLRRLGLNAVRFRTAQRRQPAKKLLRLSPLDADDSAGHAGRLKPPAGGSTPSSHVRQGEEGGLLHEALENIPDGMDRVIIRLRFYEGLSLRQVAEQIQLSPEKVRERFHFTLRRLERDLKGLA